MARLTRTSDGTTKQGLQLHEDNRVRRQMLEDLLRERHRTIEARLAARPAVADPLDAAQERAEERVRLAVLKRSHKTQERVKEALERLVTGRYGLCAVCQEPITVERLRALPFAVRCLSCQELWESGMQEG
jgi:DnaK suppressor protein